MRHAGNCVSLCLFVRRAKHGVRLGWMMMMRVWKRLLCVGLWALLCGASYGALAQDAAHFDVNEYRVSGVFLLSAAQVEQAVTPFLGPNKTINDVDKASEALEKAYHDAGYLTALVSIPQQKVDGGVVHLQVTEAAISRLRVVGSHYFSLGQIRDATPALAEGSVPDFAEVQDELGSLNHSADRRVTPVLRPGKDSGTVEVDLKVEDQIPFHGEADINNRYSQYGSPNHADVNMHWDNLWGLQHSIGLTLQSVVGNPQESSVASLNYTWPLSTEDTLALYAVRSDSNVTYSGVTNVVGTGDIYGLRYVKTLPGHTGFMHSATFGVDYKDFGQTVSLVNAGGFDTPITYLPWLMEWDGTWSDDTSLRRFGISFNFHVSDLVGSDQQFADKRYKGLSNYSYFKGNASRKDTFNDGWTLELRSTWQVTGQALVSNEQFAIGGSDTVRGYLESSALGDLGAAGTVELSTPNLMHTAEGAITDMRFLTFLDAGSVEVLDSLTDTNQYTMVGAGVGVRLSGSHGLSLTLDYATALRSMPTVNINSGDGLVHFKLAYEW